MLNGRPYEGGGSIKIYPRIRDGDGGNGLGGGGNGLREAEETI